MKKPYWYETPGGVAEALNDLRKYDHNDIYGELEAKCRCVYPNKCFCKQENKQ